MLRWGLAEGCLPCQHGEAGLGMLHLPFAAPGKHCCSPKLRPCRSAHLPRCPVPPHPSPRSGYVLGPVLGKGGFCSVRKALHELTGQAVACKIIEKGKLKVGRGGDVHMGRGCRWAVGVQAFAHSHAGSGACRHAPWLPCLLLGPKRSPTPTPALLSSPPHLLPPQDPKDRDRVDRECRVMRNLSNHCAVIKLFEYVETRDCVYIMMEAAKRGWVGGRDGAAAR